MKKKEFTDILFYLIIPLFIWNFGKEKLGDYYAMLLEALPAFVYTLYSFQKDRQYNITGIFILLSVILRRISDFAAGSAVGVLWNGVYIDISYAIFYMITIAIKKPIGLYFFIGNAYLQGYPHDGSVKFNKSKGLIKYFQCFTGLFAISSFIEAILKIWLLGKYGDDSFNQISIIIGVNGYILFSGLKIVFILYIVNGVKHVIRQNTHIVRKC